MSHPHRWTPPRLLLALLLAALAAGAVPVRAPASREQASGAAWRAAAARPPSPRPDLDQRGVALPPDAAEPLSLPPVLREGEPPVPQAFPAQQTARSPLPRAPPRA